MREKLVSNPIAIRLAEVSDEINAIDIREHPTLDRQAEAALPFLRVWLFDALVAGQIPDLSSRDAIAEQYATAWLNGWRPSPTSPTKEPLQGEE